MEIAIIGGVLVAIAALLFGMLRSSPKPAGAAKAASGKVVSPQKAPVARTAASAQQAAKQARHDRYRAVSIRCGAQACEEAQALGDRRFLVGQLKKLPLPGCTSADCKCTFEHHPDRRSSHGDKRVPGGLRSELYVASGNTERRKRRGRRKDDFL